VNDEFELVVGEHVSGLTVGSITTFGGSEGTSELSSDHTIDTSWSSPAPLKRKN